MTTPNHKNIPDHILSWMKRILAVILLVVGVFLVYTTIQSEGAGGQEHSSVAYATILSVVPPVLAIVLALVTKEVYSSLLAGIIVAALFYANGNLEIALQTMLVQARRWRLHRSPYC